MSDSHRSRLLALARRRGVLTTSEIDAAGIHSQTLTRLVREGTLDRIGRGQYRLAGREVSEHHGLAVAQKASPRGVVCLLSALAFHRIGTQLPADVWIALERGARPPARPGVPLQVVHFSGAAFAHGIEVYEIEGVRVRVYSVAKTLADLFKYRNRLGPEIPIEALREAWEDRRFTMSELDRAAEACRVERVMAPYVEAVVS